MKFKHILSILGLLFVSFFSYARSISVPPSQVTVGTQLASPIILEGKPAQNYLKISLTGKPVETQIRVPINLALVIDRSGSMSGGRIEKAREAAIMAINMLNEDDIISVIAYDSNAQVIIPATRVSDKKKLINIINDKVIANGMTALFAGLSKGINQVDKYLDREKVNRVILLSDGQANVGPTSVNELSELAVIAAKKGIAVTTVGIGSGYNEVLMASIASYSDGNHAFVNDSADLESVFVREFNDVMSVVAQEVTVTIKLNNNVKPIRLLGRNGDIRDNTVTVKMNQLYSNQEKYVLLEFMPEEGQVNQYKTVANVEVHYDDLVNKVPQNYYETINVSYTDQTEVVKRSVVEEVLAESLIQQVTLDNDEALKLYNAGKTDEAKKIMQQNSDKLMDVMGRFSSPMATSRALEQAEKNQIMAETMDEQPSDVYLKSATEMQYNSKQSNIKK